MTWLNPPAAEHFGDGVLTVRSKGKTDFWRKTFYGYVTDNGHFMYLPDAGRVHVAGARRTATTPRSTTRPVSWCDSTKSTG